MLDQWRSLLYVLLYFLLTVGFTYFYTAFTFKPDETPTSCARTAGSSRASDRARPRATTSPRWSSASASRAPCSWAWWRCAIDPARSLFPGSVVASFSARRHGLLIVVSVVVETMKQIEAQLMMRNYEGFIR